MFYFKQCCTRTYTRVPQLTLFSRVTSYRSSVGYSTPLSVMPSSWSFQSFLWARTWWWWSRLPCWDQFFPIYSSSLACVSGLAVFVSRNNPLILSSLKRPHHYFLSQRPPCSFQQHFMLPLDLQSPLNNSHPISSTFQEPHLSFYSLFTLHSYSFR